MINLLSKKKKKTAISCLFLVVFSILFILGINFIRASIESISLTWESGDSDLPPDVIAMMYKENAGNICREMIVFREDKYSERSDTFGGRTCGTGSWIPNNPASFISSIGFPNELSEPTAVARGLDYNNCEHLFVVKDNRWSEKLSGADCPYQGWLPVGDLDDVPEALGIKWPSDMQNPDAIAMDWDGAGKRHIYVFKENDYREYSDFDRPYIYRTTDQGLSYSICTYFESNYPALTDYDCGEVKSSNYPPILAELNSRQISIGGYLAMI